MTSMYQEQLKSLATDCESLPDPLRPTFTDLRELNLTKSSLTALNTVCSSTGHMRVLNIYLGEPRVMSESEQDKAMNLILCGQPSLRNLDLCCVDDLLASVVNSLEMALLGMNGLRDQIILEIATNTVEWVILVDTLNWRLAVTVKITCNQQLSLGSRLRRPAGVLLGTLESANIGCTNKTN